MARANSIFIVTYPDRTIVGAFTVKHELADWLRRRHPENREHLKVIRVRDGDPYVSVAIPVGELA